MAQRQLAHTDPASPVGLPHRPLRVALQRLHKALQQEQERCCLFECRTPATAMPIQCASPCDCPCRLVQQLIATTPPLGVVVVLPATSAPASPTPIPYPSTCTVPSGECCRTMAAYAERLACTQASSGPYSSRTCNRLREASSQLARQL